jgi:hypothetical protein
MNPVESTVTAPIRINLKPICATPDNQIKINVRRASKYPRVEWGALRYPACAVVGGGPSVLDQLDVLRMWNGDVFAINDTGKFLSDNGIPNYVISVDGTRVPFRIGPLVKGALFATRVHRCQFTQFKDLPIRVFDMAEEDNIKGIEGGATTVCRTPHLLLRMGYSGVVYFGFDGSFDGDMTHVSGYSDSARDNMLIVRAGGNDYVTHAGFLLQHEYMMYALKKYPQFLHNASGGLFKAMLENPETWEVVAVAEDLKKKYDEGGDYSWSKEYRGNQECMQATS